MTFWWFLFTATIYKNIIYDSTPLNCVNDEPVCPFNHTDFQADVCDALLDVLKCTDLYCAVRNYNCVLRELLDKHAPEHHRVITLRHRPCSFSDDHIQEKRIRKQLEWRWRRTRSPSDRKLFCQQKVRVTKMLDDAATEFYSDMILENANKPRNLFKVMNLILNRKVDSPLPLPW